MFIQVSSNAWFKTNEIRSIVIDENDDECINITFIDGETLDIDFEDADICAQAMESVSAQLKRHTMTPGNMNQIGGDD